VTKSNLILATEKFLKLCRSAQRHVFKLIMQNDLRFCTFSRSNKYNCDFVHQVNSLVCTEDEIFLQWSTRCLHYQQLLDLQC